eukprot:scaffold5233_cov127-Isochrysis_galbana.AAC.7
MALCAVPARSSSSSSSTAATHAHFKKRSRHGLSCARLIAHLAASALDVNSLSGLVFCVKIHPRALRQQCCCFADGAKAGQVCTSAGQSMAGSRTLCRTCMPVPPAERVELYLPVKGPNLHDRHLTWWRALIAQSATAKPLKSERAWLVWGRPTWSKAQTWLRVRVLARVKFAHSSLPDGSSVGGVRAPLGVLGNAGARGRLPSPMPAVAFASASFVSISSSNSMSRFTSPSGSAALGLGTVACFASPSSSPSPSPGACGLHTPVVAEPCPAVSAKDSVGISPPRLCVRGTQNLELADSTDVLEDFGGLLRHLLFVCGCFEALHLGFVPPLGRASAWSWPRGWLASLAPFGFAPSRCLARVRVKSEPDAPPASPAPPPPHQCQYTRAYLHRAG